MIRGINEVCSKNGAMTTLATGISSDELVHNIDVMIAQGHIKTFILLYSEKNDPVVERLKQFDVQFRGWWLLGSLRGQQLLCFDS